MSHRIHRALGRLALPGALLLAGCPEDGSIDVLATGAYCFLEEDAESGQEHASVWIEAHTLDESRRSDIARVAVEWHRADAIATTELEEVDCASFLDDPPDAEGVQFWSEPRPNGPWGGQDRLDFCTYSKPEGVTFVLETDAGDIVEADLEAYERSD